MKKFMKRMKDQAGLTLVELLAVIVILGILAAIAVPSILGIIQNTRMDAVKADAITVLNMAKLEVSTNAKKYEDLDTTTSETIPGTTLATYLDGGKFIELGSDKFEVIVTLNGNNYEFGLISDAITVGNKTIKFGTAASGGTAATGATIDDINESSNDVGEENNITIEEN